MNLLALGCLHGKVPAGLKSFVKKNKVDLIFSLGDHCDGDVLRDIQFKNWDAFKGKNFYKVLRKLLGKRYKKEILHYAKSGTAVLRSLDSLGKPVLVCLGNNDFDRGTRTGSKINSETIEETCKKSKNLIYTTGKSKELENYFLAAVPDYRGAGDKSMKKKKHFRKKYSWEKKLLKLFSRAHGKKIIFIGHDQPLNCRLDKIINKASPLNGKHIGDEIIRKFILKEKPPIYIGAHMHEHWGFDKIGKTKIIACGYGRKRQAAMIELPSLEVKLVKI